MYNCAKISHSYVRAIFVKRGPKFLLHINNIIDYIYKNELLFPLVTTSRVHGWADIAHSFFKMFFEVQRKSSWREKFEKLPRK
jgi:hypothetical protein